MKKNIMKKVILIVVVVTLSLASTVAFANVVDFGAKGAKEQTDYSLEEMLKYAIEDEYLAHAEYEVIINKFGDDRPFTNIIRAEEKHIGELEEIFKTYGLEIPVVDPSGHVVLPETIEQAFETGIKAEIENIAMYEKFLTGELPDDVREVFENLKKGSESHLQAFTRNAMGEKGYRRNDNNNFADKGMQDRQLGNGKGIMSNRMNNQSSRGINGQGQENGLGNQIKGYGNRNTDERLYQNQKLECDGECD